MQHFQLKIYDQSFIFDISDPIISLIFNFPIEAKKLLKHNLHIRSNLCLQ